MKVYTSEIPRKKCGGFVQSVPLTPKFCSKLPDYGLIRPGGLKLDLGLNFWSLVLDFLL